MRHRGSGVSSTVAGARIGERGYRPRPAGAGMPRRREFLKKGDAAKIEIAGWGTLGNPMVGFRPRKPVD